MDKWISSFVIGTLLSLFLPKVPVLFCLILWFFCFILSFGLPIVKYIHFVLLGILWITGAEELYQSPSQEFHHYAFINKDVLLVEGKVKNIPRYEDNKQYFTFEINKLNHREVKSSFLVRLSWKKAPQKLQQDQVWKLNIRLKPAHGFGNVGAFNYRTWLRYQQIFAKGYVINHSGKIQTPNTVLNDQVSIRQELYNRFHRILTEKPLNGVLTALSFGERGGISNEQRHILQITATGHLIAISGLHLGLIATGSFFMFSLCFKYLPLSFLPIGSRSRFVHVNRQYIVIIGSLMITFFYAYISGFSLPTLRALCMISLYWLLRLSGIQMSWRSIFLYTVFFIILFWPFSLMSMSFWLSFYAVLVIFLVSWRLSLHRYQENTKLSWLKSLFYLQLTLSLALLPLTLLINYEFSLLAVIANLVAVPLMSFTAIPLCLLGTLSLYFFPSLAMLLFNTAYFFVDLLWNFLAYLSEQSWAIISLDFIAICLTSVLILFFCFKLLYCVSWSKFDFIIPSFILATFLYSQTKKEHLWQVNILDVGQGLSVLIEKNSRALLYDTGASYPGGFNFVDSALVPYLKHQGITKLDEVIISHSDNDHAGGLPNIKALELSPVIRANDISLNAKLTCLADESFLWQGLSFSILWPLSPLLGRENDDSCVIKISDGEHTVLLTGDISSNIEKYLVNANVNLDADVLIIPHHGSKTSSHEEFITKVSPRFGVFSSGYLNRWNMPDNLVLMRYKNQDVELFNTADQGMIRFVIQGDEIKPYTYGDDLWPFWFAH